VNQGGDQGHDDYGLPRVDIEIPDDARELYRDVQAYHRELRALRRHQRSMRWRAPFRRSGVAIPLLAGCLVAALVAVMVSAMFSANPYFNGGTNQRSAGQSSAAGSPSAGGSSNSAMSSGNPAASPSGGMAGPAPSPGSSTSLPAGRIISVADQSISLRKLSSTALAIVPANCNCAAAVSHLLEQAASEGVIIYLVAPPGGLTALEKLLAVARPAGSTLVATDADNVLSSAFQPRGLTVLLVNAQGKVVTVRRRLRPDLMLERQLKLVRPAG
jgi:hypothetical protein